MAILIKGMEMPQSCDDCRIMMLEDTNCVPELFCGCPIVFKAHPQGVGHRPDYCPLVPIPPHGRCIDADKLTEEMRLFIKENMLSRDDARELLETIEDAPTIIPADGNMDTDFWGEEYAKAKGLEEEGEQ